MTILLLSLLTASGYPVGWSLMKLVTAEEAMVASGKGRDLKVIGKLLIYVLLSAVVSIVLMCLIALDENVTSDQIAIFGIGTMVFMGIPILRVRWLQMKKKNSKDR